MFRPGYDVDIAAVDVQNKLQAAMPSLPQAVQAQGVQVLKANPALVMAVAITSKNPSFDYAYLNNLAGTLVADAIKRLPGTGNVQQTGYPYSMRLWLNPQRLADLSITVNDIINVVKDQNNNYSTGQVGLAPSPTGQVLTIPILTKGYLSEVSEFREPDRPLALRRRVRAHQGCRAGRARRAGLHVQLADQRGAGCGAARVAAVRRQCSATVPKTCGAR